MSDNDIANIQARNARVEADKAWETSKTRRIVIAIATYLIAAIYMAFLGIEAYYLHALVPTGGFLLSTLSLLIIKSWWLRKLYKL